MAPDKRHAYKADFKLNAISHAVQHGNRAAAREFNINESMVRKWIVWFCVLCVTTEQC